MTIGWESFGFAAALDPEAQPGSKSSAASSTKTARRMRFGRKKGTTFIERLERVFDGKKDFPAKEKKKHARAPGDLSKSNFSCRLPFRTPDNPRVSGEIVYPYLRIDYKPGTVRLKRNTFRRPG